MVLQIVLIVITMSMHLSE